MSFDKALVAIATVLGAVFLCYAFYGAGVTVGRQQMPVACEPKCEFVYRGTKLINVTCPDSTGVLRGQGR